MAISVAREHHWPPNVIGGLFFDAVDYKGLTYWYNDAKEVERQMKSKLKTKEDK